MQTMLKQSLEASKAERDYGHQAVSVYKQRTIHVKPMSKNVQDTGKNLKKCSPGLKLLDGSLGSKLPKTPGLRTAAGPLLLSAP